MGKIERGLGRGLDALFSSSPDYKYDTEEISQIDMDLIIARENQPRQNFDVEALNELAKSIEEHGLLQPVLVRPLGNKYEIIAGERRYRAAKIANIEFLPVVIKDITDNEAFEIALVENLQREDLSIIEEAHAYKNMIEKFNYSQEEVAKKIGKSRVHVANTLRILNLPPEILQMLDDKLITPGHARTLLSVTDSQEQIKLAEEIINGKISVREAEEKAKTRKGQIVTKPIEIIEIEDMLQKHLATKAEVVPKKKGGSIQISYYNEDDLKRILDLLGIILK